jgi:hypothetical protein
MVTGTMPAKRSFLWRLQLIILGAVSVFCLFAWLILPFPRPEELTEIAGTLASYSVESHARFSRTGYVLFSPYGSRRPVLERIGHTNKRYGRFPSIGTSTSLLLVAFITVSTR